MYQGQRRLQFLNDYLSCNNKRYHVVISFFERDQLLGRIIEALDIVCTYIFGNFLGRVTTLE